MSRLLSIPLLLAALLAACGESPPADENVVARVDGKVLTVDDIRVVDPTGTLTADEVKTLVDNWIERELLMKIAERRGILADTAVRWQIEAERSRIALERLGVAIRAETGNETRARAVVDRALERMRKESRVEANPWRVK